MANARQRASGHVSNRVAASFTSRDADSSKTPHDIRRVVDVNVVKLEILTRRDVQDVVRILSGKLRQSIQLSRSHTAKRNLDTLHSRRVPQRFGTFGHVSEKVQLLCANPIVTMAVVISLPITA